jgi:hypothetical protein
MSWSRPFTLATVGMQYAFFRSGGLLPKSVLRSVFQATLPVRLSSATMYCTSIPSQWRMK